MIIRSLTMEVKSQSRNTRIAQSGVKEVFTLEKEIPGLIMTPDLKWRRKDWAETRQV
jgi:hypothetical protein